MIQLNLRAKVLFFTVLVVAMLIVTSHIVTNTIVAAGLRQQLEKRLERSADNFAEWVSNRKEQILAIARSIAENDMMPSSVDWTEPNYVGTVLEILLSRREPDMLMVESVKSGWIYQMIDDPTIHGSTLPLRAFELPEAQWQAGLTEVLPDGDRLMLTVGVPVRSELDLLGLLTVGMAIDEASTSDIRYACGCDHLSVVVGENLLLSTLPQETAPALLARLPEQFSSDETYDIELVESGESGGGNYLTRIQPLSMATGETVASVLIQMSDEAGRRLLADVTNALNLTGLAAFVVFSIISVIYSGQITTKLKTLVGHATALGEGRYEEPVSVASTDEVGLLSRSFEDLRLKLRQRTAELLSANEDLDRRVREIGILNQAMVAIASNLPMEEVFALISREASAFMPVDYSYLVLRIGSREDGGDALKLLAWHAEQGAPGEEPRLEPGASLAEEAMRRGELLIREELVRNSRFSDEAWLAEGGLLSANVLPLLADGVTIGALCLAGFRRHEVDSHARDFLHQLATEITIALQRMRLNEELQLIESRLSRLFDSVRDGIFQTDAEGEIVFVNAAALAMFGPPGGDGGSPEDIEGQNFEKMLVVPKERRELLGRLRKYGYVTNFPARLSRTDGSSFDAELSVNFTDGEAGSRGIEGIVRDVTERNKLEQQLLRSERMASMGQIAAGVAHEINNPLGIVLGFTQDLRSSKREADPDQESLRVIEQETERCARIVKDLLNLAAEGEPMRKELLLAPLMERTLKLYALHLRDAGIDLVKDFEEEGRILGDEQQIQQIFMNVILNSIHAISEAGRRGRIRVSIASDDDEILAGIEDNGCGIPAETLDKIFDPFFSTKGGGGTGLGLFIVHRLVDANGGSVAVESTPGKGTKIIVRFPQMD